MNGVVQKIMNAVRVLLGTSDLPAMYHEIHALRTSTESMLRTQYLHQNLLMNPAYTKSKKITHFHRSVYAQNGEDGIIEEIFKRINTTNKFFVEFGVHGVKNNSTYLLLKEWKGLWLGGGTGVQEIINIEFKQPIEKERLRFRSEWITSENIQDIFQQENIPPEFDFLSIDIDGNDYWIWKAIERYSPRVVCIEYNATFPPDVNWVMEYNPKHRWNQTNYFGASLSALENLGRLKGYALIGCDFAGCNAFFVRGDINLELFEAPFTASHHYEPPRYFLELPNGHTPGFGPYSTEL